MRSIRFIPVLRRLAPGAAVVLLFALAARGLWRDGMAFSAPTFYALPLPLHVAGWGARAALWWRPARLRSFLRLALATFCGGYWWFNTASLRREIAAQSPAPGPVVLFWNIGHTHEVPARIHELILEHEPDAAAFAEAENLGEAGRTELLARHAGHDVISVPGGMVCMVKGRATLQSHRALPQRSWVVMVEAAFTRLPGQVWHLCLADVGPLPPLPRLPILTEIFTTTRNQPRTIVAGDFNTPLDAMAFDEWRGAFYHAHADCPAWGGAL